MTNETISMDVFRNSGRKGGLATAKRGKEFYQKIGKMGSTKRWSKAKTPPTR